MLKRIRYTFLGKEKTAASFFRKEVKSPLTQEIYKELTKNIGSGTNGSRLWPRNKRNDQKYGIRIDLGEKIYDASNGWFRNAIVQFNKNADNEGIRKAVGKNGTHEQRARFQIPLSGDGSGLHESITEEVVVTDMVDVMEDGT